MHQQHLVVEDCLKIIDVAGMAPSDFGAQKRSNKHSSKVALVKQWRSFFAIQRTDLSLISSLAAISRVLKC